MRRARGACLQSRWRARTRKRAQERGEPGCSRIGCCPRAKAERKRDGFKFLLSMRAAKLQERGQPCPRVLADCADSRTRLSAPRKKSSRNATMLRDGIAKAQSRKKETSRRRAPGRNQSWRQKN